MTRPIVDRMPTERVRRDVYGPPPGSTLGFDSSIQGFRDGFAWAKDVALGYVVRRDRPGVLPSIASGLLDRPLFYLRDVAHQSLGAHLLGLDEENFAMLHAFAASATERRRWYPLWSFTYDGQIAGVDWRSDDDFVRETPAPFELAQKSMELFRWTGDRRYLLDPDMLDFYRHLEDFTALHDIQGLGLAGEARAVDIWDGSPTYNEHAGLPDLQISADGVASQWAAMRALADVLGSEGAEPELAQRAAGEADRVLGLFEDLWWDAEARHYIVGLAKNRPVRGFASEASWFPMVKRMPLAPERVTSHLARLSEAVRAKTPDFLESCTYLPEAFHAYGFDRDAEHWIRHLIDSGSDYPEVPFTIVSHLVVGMTGVEPGDDGTIITRSHVPVGEWVEVLEIPYRGRLISVRQEGSGATELSLTRGEPLRWEARSAAGPSRVVEVHPGETASQTWRTHPVI
jgi:hypothetical protein